MDLRSFVSEQREKIAFFAVAGLGAVLDVATKHWVFSSLGAAVVDTPRGPAIRPGRTALVLGETLRFECTVNTGAVFSLFRGRWVFLTVFTLLSLLIILWILFRQRRGRPVTVVGLGLVCAGALGNLWDRFLFNGVRDFIVFQSSLLEPVLEGGQWPTFNVADAWIVAGIACIFLGDFVLYRRQDDAADPADGTDADAGPDGGKATKSRKKKRGKDGGTAAAEA